MYNIEWTPICLYKNAYKILIEKKEDQIWIAKSSRWFIYSHIMCVTDGAKRKMK